MSATRPWRRTQRVGIRIEIGVAHLMASSAIPFVFPPVEVGEELIGDGAMRQTAPTAPALHLGADRILVIGAARAEASPLQGANGHRPPERHRNFAQ